MRRGFSLIEVLVSAGILLVLVLVAFYVFDFGVRSAHLSGARADLQSQATRAILSLQNDLRRSTLSSVATLSRPATNPPLDALCLATVSDWSAPTAYNSTYGLPNYDRYVIYYATPAGLLVREQVNPGSDLPASTAPVYSGFDWNQCHDDPGTNPPAQLSYTVLCDQVRSFTCQVLPDRRVLASLQLTRSGARGPADGSKKFDQTYQMELEVFPQNTWPRE